MARTLLEVFLLKAHEHLEAFRPILLEVIETPDSITSRNTRQAADRSLLHDIFGFSFTDSILKKLCVALTETKQPPSDRSA